jgi:hypothetical protein
MIYDQRVGDDQVQRPWRVFAPGDTALAHAIANDFASAERDLIAINSKVPLNLNDQFRVGEPDAVASGRPVEINVSAAGNF